MLVLAGGRVLNPTTGSDSVADVVLDAGRIVRIGPDAGAGAPTSEKVRRIDLRGSWVMPGFVDLHAHFREPGHEYKEDIVSGLRAATAGGYVAVCTMANTKPVNDTRAVTEAIVARARGLGGPRLFPFGAITRGLEGRELTEMADLRAAGAVGVSDDGRCVSNALVMRRALEYARTFDILVTQHCEDHHLTEGAQMHEGPVSARLGLRGWPREAEDIIVARDLLLAEATGARYHIAHVSSLGAIRLLREAKSRGVRVTAEVTPHHLALTDEAVIGYDTACKVNPPLRSAADRAALREALRDGTIDCIATDHAPHDPNEKRCEYEAASNGIIGLETALPVLLDLVRAEVLTPLALAERLATGPARILPELGCGALRPGDRADITVVDPTMKWTVTTAALRSKSHNTPWLDKELTGAVLYTIVGGDVIYARGGAA